MNNYYNNPNNSTIYPNQPNGGMPPKKNKSNIVIIALISVAIILILAIAIVVAFNAGRAENGNRGVYVGGYGVNNTTTAQGTIGAADDADESALAKKSYDTSGYEKTDDSSSESEKKQDKKPKSEKKNKTDGYSRKNPVPLGEEYVFEYEDEFDDSENFTATMKIAEVIRGEAAFDKLKEISSYTSDPEEGYEYVLAKISMTIDSVNSDKAIEAYQWDFLSFTSNNEETPEVFESVPEPQFEGKLYEGGSLEGWALFLAKTDDLAPKLAYKLNFDGTGGAWFALY